MLAFIFGPPVGFARYVNEMVSRSGRADFIAFVTLIATSGRNYTCNTFVEKDKERLVGD